MHANAPLGEREREASGSDAELERPACPHQFGEEVHGWIDDIRIERFGPEGLVPLRYAFVEVVLWHGAHSGTESMQTGPFSRGRMGLA